MVTINGQTFYEEPGSCGTCPFLITGNTDMPGIRHNAQRGHCIQWNEEHRTWAHTPRRCAKLFKKAFQRYDNSGQELVITSKE